MHGCHGHKATAIKWSMPCPTCIGYIDPTCPNCHGDQWVEMEECINSVQRKISPKMDVIIECVDMFINYKVLPNLGGWLDQPTEFRKAFKIFTQVSNMFGIKKETNLKRLNKSAGK